MTRLVRKAMAPGLIRSASAYAGAQLFSRAIPFLLLPVVTRYLSPDAYGIVTMFLLATLVIEPILGLSLAGAVGVRFFDANVNIVQYLRTNILAIALVALVLMLPALFVYRDISAALRIPEPWILMAVPLAFVRTVVASVGSLLRSMALVRQYVATQIVQGLVLLLAVLILVVLVPTDWQGRITAELLGACVVALILVVWLARRGDSAKADPESVRHLLRFGVPLIPHIIGSILIVQTDRVLLTDMVGLSQTGLYSVGYQLVLIIEIVAVSFNAAYAPWLFSRLADVASGTKRELVRLTYLQFVVMAAFAIAVAICMPWVARTFLDPRYVEASVFVGWLALGLLFSAMYYMVTNYVFFSQKTEWLAATTLATGVLNVPVTYLLITLNGPIGAAQATAFSLGMSFLLTWIVSQRLYPMPWIQALRRTRDVDD